MRKLAWALLLWPVLAGAQSYWTKSATPLATHIYYFSGNNGICDDSTDDTAAFNALLLKVNNAGGGTIAINGTCLISGQITLPNTGGNSPTQKTIRITATGDGANGCCAASNWNAPVKPHDALDLQYSVSVTGVAISGTAGQFTCTCTNLAIGQGVLVGGTLTGSGTITGYSSGTYYYVSATNGTSTFTLQSAAKAALTTTAGTTTGLTFYPAAAKINTLGAGVLEIDHLGLIDNGSDCSPFIQTTDTILRIHNVLFFGTANQAAACNDAVVLGGVNQATPVIDGTSVSPMQGQGTVIKDDFFWQMSTIVKFNTYANGVQVVNNTVSSGSGGASTTLDGAAFVFNYAAQGNYVAGNYIEMSGYKYGFIFNAGASYNSIIGNTLWDQTGSTTAGYHCNAASFDQVIIEAYNNYGNTAAAIGNCEAFGNIVLSGVGQSYTSIPYLGIFTLNATANATTVSAFSTSAQDINIACDVNHVGFDIHIQSNGYSLKGCGATNGFGALVAKGNGSTILGNDNGNYVTVNNGTLVTLSAGVGMQLAPTVTVASLPTCNTAEKGTLLEVSDATAPTYNAALTGGGAVIVPVFCNGTSWVSH